MRRCGGIRSRLPRLAGLIHLTVMPYAANFVLAPVLQHFLTAYPDIRLDISVDAPEREVTFVQQPR